MKLIADRTDGIVGLFINCVKHNLLNDKKLSKTLTPQVNDILTCITDVTRRDTRHLDVDIKKASGHRNKNTLSDSHLMFGDLFIGMLSLDDLAKFSVYAREIEKKARNS